MSLIRKNHLNYSGEIDTGLVLWLRKKRPRWDDPQYMELAVNEQISDENSKNSPKSYFYHSVEKGDTMYKISRKYGVSIEFLKTINQRDTAFLKEGEKLIVKMIPN